MSRSNFVECERNNLQKILNFRLPHRFKYIGATIVTASFLTFFLRMVFPEQKELIRHIGRTGLIVGMLMISLSKDKIEDERTNALKAQSYAIAFILGVVYAIVMPYVEFGVSNAIKEGEAFKSLGDFQVLSFMLMVQLGMYHSFRRFV